MRTVRTENGASPNRTPFGGHHCLGFAPTNSDSMRAMIPEGRTWSTAANVTPARTVRLWMQRPGCRGFG